LIIIIILKHGVEEGAANHCYYDIVKREIKHLRVDTNITKYSRAVIFIGKINSQPQREK